MRTPPPTLTPAPIQEITGKPASLLKNGLSHVILPGSGIATLKISGDLLHAVIENRLQKQEAWIRIQQIDSIEIVQSPIWEFLVIGGGALVIGIPLILRGAVLGFGLGAVGAIAIAFFILFKHRYLCIHSQRTSLPIGLTKPPQIYQQFAMTVMGLARQLNTVRVVNSASESTTGRAPVTHGSQPSGRNSQGTPSTRGQTQGRPPITPNTQGRSTQGQRMAEPSPPSASLNGQTSGYPHTQLQ